MVIPLTFAILIWHETPNTWQILGIFLTCGALPLLCTNDPVEVAPNNVSTTTGGLGAVVVSLTFANAGVGRLVMKIFNETCPMDQKPFYLFFLFSVTTFVLLSSAFIERSCQHVGNMSLVSWLEFPIFPKVSRSYWHWIP